MVTWPINLIHFRLKSYISQPQLFSPLVRFATATTLLSSLHQLGYNLLNQSTLALFGEKVLHISMSRRAEMLEHMLKRLLADQRLSRSVMVKREEWTQSSTKKPPRGAAGKQWEDGQLGMIDLTFRTSISASTCGKVEGLDVTLDDPAGFADRFWWMIGCECVIHKWSKLHLGPLGLRGADSKNNTKSRKYF